MSENTADRTDATEIVVAFNLAMAIRRAKLFMGTVCHCHPDSGTVLGLPTSIPRPRLAHRAGIGGTVHELFPLHDAPQAD